jgi:HK97 family phage portal protein
MINLFNKNHSTPRQRIEPVIDMDRTVQNADSETIKMGPNEFGEFVRGGMSSAAGKVVSEKTAMRVSAVYACVRLIGGTIASLPLPVYDVSNGERQRAEDDPVWWLLNQQPNDKYSAAVFWESMLGSLLLNGDGFAAIQRPSIASPVVRALEWYPSKNVEVIEDNNRLVYLMTKNGKQKAMLADDVIHVPGPGFDGKRGMSQIKHALSNAAGTALAADEFSGKFFANGARPDFALEFPGSLDENQQDMIRRTWAERHQGSSNAHLPALMSGGAKVHEITMNAEDAQLITTRKFQVEDIARIFGVPPHMIGHTEKSSSWGTGVEQMSIGFVKYTLAPLLTKIEQELNRKLFDGTRRRFSEFNTAGLERGDYKTRMEGYRTALGRAGEPGWMTVNEIRKLENQPPVEGGNELNKGNGDESTSETTGTE